MAFTGLVMGPGGVLHNVEIQGPPTLEAWKESYDVLFSALIMLDTVRRPQLVAYRAKICALHAQYGAQSWALLYQADVRCRYELMDRLRYRELAKHNAALQATPPRRSEYDPARPWDCVWAAAIKESDFWEKEFKHNALLIRTNTIKIAETLGNDARIVGQATSSTDHPRWINPVEKPLKSNPGAKKAAAPKGPCKSFNQGKCPGDTCPNGYGLHKCSNCGLSNHGAYNCRDKGTKKRKFNKRG